MSSVAQESDRSVVWLGDDPNDPDRIVCRLRIADPSCVGHDATLTLERVVHVKDANPIHHRQELWRTSFHLASAEQELSVPRTALGQGYAYEGHQIEVRIESRLKIDDGILRDTEVQGVHRLGALDRPKLSGDAKELAEPADAFQFFANLAAIPADARAKTIALLAVGGVLIVTNALIGWHDQFLPDSMTWVYDHVDSDGDSQSPLVTALMGCGAIGALVWLAIRKQLRRYMEFHLHPLGQITRGTQLPAAALVAGRSRVALERVTVRVVAYNLECGQYVRGSGTKRRTVTFSTPARALKLYEQLVPHVPAHSELSDHLTGDVSFDAMFGALYPPLMVGDKHGVQVRWEVQLLHPEYVDQEVVRDDGLRYEDFLDA
jgi:hypothetical protein